MCADVDLDQICGTGRSQKKIPGQNWRDPILSRPREKKIPGQNWREFFLFLFLISILISISSTLYIVMNLDNIENNIAKQTFQGKKRSPGMVNQGEVGADLYLFVFKSLVIS